MPVLCLSLHVPDKNPALFCCKHSQHRSKTEHSADVLAHGVGVAQVSALQEPLSFVPPHLFWPHSDVMRARSSALLGESPYS